MDVEDVKRKETKLLRHYINKQDAIYSSAHLKAGRKILDALRKRA